MRYPSFNTALCRFRKNISCLPAGERQVLREAYCIAKRAHRGQKKFGLYPYIIHPLSVFNFLFEKLHVRTRHILAAALLHDVVEDTDISLDTFKKQFGPETYNIVKTVTRIPKAGETEADKKTLKMRHFRQVVCEGSREAKILGIADKYDNVRRMPLIPQSSPHRKKIPRWVSETKAFVALAESTDTTACRELKKVLTKLEHSGGKNHA